MTLHVTELKINNFVGLIFWSNVILQSCMLYLIDKNEELAIILHVTVENW